MSQYFMISGRVSKIPSALATQLQHMESGLFASVDTSFTASSNSIANCATYDCRVCVCVCVCVVCGV